MDTTNQTHPPVSLSVSRIEVSRITIYTTAIGLIIVLQPDPPRHWLKDVLGFGKFIIMTWRFATWLAQHLHH